MKHRGIRIATQQDVREFIDRCLAVEEAGRSVVEAYRAMRAAGSFSGFWTHIDDLAKALPVDAASREASPSHPVADTVVGRDATAPGLLKADVSDSESAESPPTAAPRATEPIWTTTACPHCGGEVDGIRVLTEAEIGRPPSSGSPAAPESDPAWEEGRPEPSTNTPRSSGGAGFAHPTAAAPRPRPSPPLP